MMKSKQKSIAEIEAENNQKSAEVDKREEEKDKAVEGQLHVIDTAKLKCDLCVTPMGDLKVNFDTPTIQDKKTATIKEKDMTSLIFKGNCKKSPNSSSPCASVMQLGEWKDTGTSLIQDQPPLLLKSTIKCNYGGVDIAITDCGQKCEPEEIDVVGAPAPPPLSLKKFLVHFRRPSNYKGEFGFDWLRDEYIYPITSVNGINKELSLDIPKLKTEYKTTDVTNAIPLNGKDYYCSFLNIMLNQEVTLDIEVEELEALSLPDTTEIIFESSNPKLTINPTSIPLSTLIAGGKTNPKNPDGTTKTRDYYLAANQIKVKCDGLAFTKNEQIKIFAKLVDNGVESKKEVGKMMVMENSDQSKYTIDVYIIKSYLKDSSAFGLSNIDIEFNKIGGLAGLEKYLNENSLNQGLIQVKVIPLSDWVFTEQTLVNTSSTPNTDYTGMIVNRATMLMDNAKYMNFINDRFEVGYPAIARKKGIFIYLTPFLSPSAGGASYNSPLTSKHIILFKHNLDHLSSYAHEIGHTLGLEHTFKEGQTVQQKIVDIQNKLASEKAEKSTRFRTYAGYYTTHPQEKIKDAIIYDKNIKSYEDQLNVLKKNPYKFEDRTTENMMDYDLTNQKTFFKWQWKVIQNEAKSYYH